MRLFKRFGARRCAVVVSACLMLAAGASRGAIDVPAGASVSLGGGTMDMGCTDITVGGNLQLMGSGVTNVHDVTIQGGASPNGTLDGGSGSLVLAGSWANGGTFVPGTGTVSFFDSPGCATGSTLSGNTSFYNLSLISSVGKAFTIPPSTTQTVLNTLTMQGTLADPLQIVSGVPGSHGNLHLAAGGAQNISHVGISGNWATGQALATQATNEGGTGDARGWFGDALSNNVGIPAMGPAGIALLVLMLAGLGMGFGSRRKHTR